MVRSRVTPGEYAFLRSRRWLGYLAAVFAFAIACAFLSHWQFDRNAQRIAANAVITANYDGPLKPLAEVLPGRTAPLSAEHTWSRVELTGHYDIGATHLVRNRPLDSQPGYEVVVPFVTSDGTALLVDRGWIPTGGDGGAPKEIPAPDAGEVSLVARIEPSEKAKGQSTADGQLAAIDPAAVTGSSAPLFTRAFGVAQSESPAPAQALTAQPAPTIDSGPFLSYAIQWLCFALLAFMAYLWAARQERQRLIEERVLRSMGVTIGAPSEEEVERLRQHHEIRRTRAALELERMGREGELEVYSPRAAALELASTRPMIQPTSYPEASSNQLRRRYADRPPKPRRHASDEETEDAILTEAGYKGRELPGQDDLYVPAREHLTGRRPAELPAPKDPGPGDPAPKDDPTA